MPQLILHKEMDILVEIIEQRGGFYIIKHPFTGHHVKSAKDLYDPAIDSIEKLNDRKRQTLIEKERAAKRNIPSIMRFFFDSKETWYRIVLSEIEVDRYDKGLWRIFCDPKTHTCFFCDRDTCIRLQTMKHAERMQEIGSYCLALFRLGRCVSFKRKGGIWKELFE